MNTIFRDTSSGQPGGRKAHAFSTPAPAPTVSSLGRLPYSSTLAPGSKPSAPKILLVTGVITLLYNVMRRRNIAVIVVASWMSQCERPDKTAPLYLGTERWGREMCVHQTVRKPIQEAILARTVLVGAVTCPPLLSRVYNTCSPSEAGAATDA